MRGRIPARASVRRVPGAMNGTEAAYAQALEEQRCAGEVAWWAFEAVTLKLARDLRYTPDFIVQLADGTLEAHEVKGFWRDDARAKIKMAAALFPLRFIAVQRAAKRDGGGWVIEAFDQECQKDRKRQ